MLEKNISSIAGITQKEIIQYQHWLYRLNKNMKGQTVMFYMRNMHVFCTYLYNANMIWKNPFNVIRYIDPPEQKDRVIKRRYTFGELITAWLNYMIKDEYHIQTVHTRERGINFFVNYLKQRGIKSVYKITSRIIDEYKEYLNKYEYEPGRYYTPLTQIELLRDACCFLLYLDRGNKIKANPAGHIVIRRYAKELFRKHILPEIAGRKKLQKPYISDPEIEQLLQKFIQYKYSLGLTKINVHTYIRSVKKFYEYINSIGITDLRKITKREIIDYQTWLYNQKTKDGNEYAPNSLHNLIVCLRSFFTFLVKYDYLQCDPTSSVDLPKKERGLPRTCMDGREIKILLEKPDLSTVTGFRDRAIFEVLYSTGLRANELIHVKTNDINFTQGLIRVDVPKGGKSNQRVVPIGKTACEYVKQYLERIRPVLDKDGSKGYLFLTAAGERLRRDNLSIIIRKYLLLTGLRKQITSHSFRVSCATHMLDNGADIRYVQEQLGHKDIRTTQIYTRLIPKGLKRIHTIYHPREKMLTKCNNMLSF